jgi:hypothetical protein
VYLILFNKGNNVNLRTMLRRIWTLEGGRGRRLEQTALGGAS